MFNQNHQEICRVWILHLIASCISFQFDFWEFWQKKLVKPVSGQSCRFWFKRVRSAAFFNCANYWSLIELDQLDRNLISKFLIFRVELETRIRLKLETFLLHQEVGLRQSSRHSQKSSRKLKQRRNWPLPRVLKVTGDVIKASPGKGWLCCKLSWWPTLLLANQVLLPSLWIPYVINSWHVW